MTTISGLMPSTTYTIQVAVVNSAGTGVYSVPTAIETDGKICCITVAGPIVMQVYTCTCSYMLISCEYKGHHHVSGESLGVRLHRSSIHSKFCMVVCQMIAEM